MAYAKAFEISDGVCLCAFSPSFDMTLTDISGQVGLIICTRITTPPPPSTLLNFKHRPTFVSAIELNYTNIYILCILICKSMK
jgi:hypothetical protein